MIWYASNNEGDYEAYDIQDITSYVPVPGAGPVALTTMKSYVLVISFSYDIIITLL
jgi:hypothetical protein